MGVPWCGIQSLYFRTGVTEVLARFGIDGIENHKRLYVVLRVLFCLFLQGLRSARRPLCPLRLTSECSHVFFSAASVLLLPTEALGWPTP